MNKMNFLKRISIFEALLVVVILGIHLYAALADAYNFPNVWFKRDDAYYYFKVAQNITEGNGSTFDGINLNQWLSSPMADRLYSHLCACPL
jgi:hypothetical protein